MIRTIPFVLALAVHMSAAAQAPGSSSDDSPPASTDDAVPSTSEVEAPDPEREEILRRYQIAVERSDAGDCEAAVAEFEEIYRLLGDDPRRANVLFNMGICYEQLLRFDEAMNAYNRFLSEQPDASERGEIERSIRRLDGMLGTLEVRSNVPASVWLGEREVGQVEGGALTVRVTAGSHTVELRAAGHESARQEVSVASGITEQLQFELDALSDFDGVSTAWTWVFGGATVLVGAGSAVAGIIALQRGNIDGRLRTEEDAARVRAPALASDVLLGLTGALAITTIILGLSADWDDETQPAVRVRAGAGSLHFEGRF